MRSKDMHQRLHRLALSIPGHSVGWTTSNQKEWSTGLKGNTNGFDWKRLKGETRACWTQVRISSAVYGSWWVSERTIHRSKGARGALAAEEKEPLGRGLERTAREKGPEGSFFS